MNVFIARDGSIIGEYPRADLEAMARRGELEMEDHFWQEGMEDWLPLPDLLGSEAWLASSPPPSPRSPWLYLGLGFAAVLIFAGLIRFFILPDRPSEALPVAIDGQTSMPDAPAAGALRDKAAADLRARIERLPARAAPPSHNFYYDVRVHMQRTFSTDAPWAATMRGFENVVDPATQETLRRTEFVLRAEYRDGAWVYRGYEASVNDLKANTTHKIQEPADTPILPVIAGIMGLRRAAE